MSFTFANLMIAIFPLDPLNKPVARYLVQPNYCLNLKKEVLLYLAMLQHFYKSF
jgi:hypothetical protein